MKAWTTTSWDLSVQRYEEIAGPASSTSTKLLGGEISANVEDREIYTTKKTNAVSSSSRVINPRNLSIFTSFHAPLQL